MKKRRRAISLLLSVCAAFCILTASLPGAQAAAVWDGAPARGFASGDGAESSPYVVETAKQLAYLAEQVNGGASFSGKFIVLTANLTLNSLTSVYAWDDKPPANTWTAIGTLSHPFSGTFDGNGHTISGLYISTLSSYQGLFGCVSGGSVKNTVLASSYISGGSYVGGIVGRLYADKESGGYASVFGCGSSGTVKGGGYVGGIAGLCYAYLSGSTATVSSCFNSGSVTGGSYNVGGVVGRNMANPASADSSAFANVKNCYSSGTVSGLDYVGGVAGQNSASAYSTAAVISCYSVGALSGGGRTGGIVGQNYASATGTASVKNCYFLSGTASVGAVNSDGGGREQVESVQGRNASGLQTEDGFTGFDFESVWTFGEASAYRYPTLRRVTAAPSEEAWVNPFTDVPDDAPYIAAVKTVVTSGLMNGTGAHTFSPSVETTRGMTVTVLWRMSGKPAASRANPFSDVAAGAYYETPIAWAAEHGIVSGYGNGSFLPDVSVTRQELAVILYNYARFIGKNVSVSANMSAYSDASSVAPWASAALGWCVRSGIVTGVSATELSPTSRANRAQTAIMLTRLASVTAA